MSNITIDPNPKMWGPPLWKLLHTITFKYPEKIDPRNSEHTKVKNKVKKIFSNLKRSIPCKPCRDSYVGFTNSLPIERHLHGRNSLSYWLYRIHNMVNAKLRRYESEEFKRGLHQLDEHSRIHRISPADYNRMKSDLKTRIMITGPDPDYNEVKQTYKYARYF